MLWVRREAADDGEKNFEIRFAYKFGLDPKFPVLLREKSGPDLHHTLARGEPMKRNINARWNVGGGGCKLQLIWSHIFAKQTEAKDLKGWRNLNFFGIATLTARNSFILREDPVHTPRPRIPFRAPALESMKNLLVGSSSYCLISDHLLKWKVLVEEMRSLNVWTLVDLF